MADSDAKPAYSALNGVLGLWRSGGVSRLDLRRLEALIDSTLLVPLWKRISKTKSSRAAEIATRLFLIELFDAAEVPPWDKLSGSKRNRRLAQIEGAARRLHGLLSGTPIRHFSEDALDQMELDYSSEDAMMNIRRVRGSDFQIALADVRGQVDALREAAPILRRPTHEDAPRRYFVLRITRYLQRKFQSRSNRLIAELARIMLNDASIDIEDIRKMLGSM